MEMNRGALLTTIKELINQLAESSSSSDEDDLTILLGENPLSTAKRVVRDIACTRTETESLDISREGDRDNLLGKNSLPKVKTFVEGVVSAYTDAEFKQNFGISRDLSAELVAKYSASSWYKARNYRGGRQQKSAKTHVLAFLWFSANKTTLRDVADLFEMSLSNMHYTFNRVLNFFVNDIAPDVIKMPKEAHEKEANALGFQNIAGFPNVLGCIGESLIIGRKSKDKIHSNHTNRQSWQSITLQGICDANLRFMDIFTDVPRRKHNATVSRLPMNSSELSCTCAPKYHLLGTSAYPLREYLLTPYRDHGNLSEAEWVYNTKFAQTKIKIDDAFGLLKSRFRQLVRLDFHNVQSMAKFVNACCALHNLCIERGELLDISDTNITNTAPENTTTIIERFDVCHQQEQFLTQLGQIKRENIKNQLHPYIPTYAYTYSTNFNLQCN